MPPPLARSVPKAGAARPSGATRRASRDGLAASAVGGGRAAGSTAASRVAAATLVAVLFVVPAVRKAGRDGLGVRDPREVGEPAVGRGDRRGVEVLEYELVLDGVPKEMMPDQVDGTYRVWQAIDHDVPGRFRFASYARRRPDADARSPRIRCAKRRVAGLHRRKGSRTAST